VQNLQLAKMRTKFNEKILSLSAHDLSTKSPPSFFVKAPHNLLTKSVSSYGYNSNISQQQLRPNGSSVWNRMEASTSNSSNSANARQRIQNKTNPVPFYGSSGSQQQANNEEENLLNNSSFFESSDKIIEL